MNSPCVIFVSVVLVACNVASPSLSGVSDEGGADFNNFSSSERWSACSTSIYRAASSNTASTSWINLDEVVLAFLSNLPSFNNLDNSTSIMILVFNTSR